MVHDIEFLKAAGFNMIRKHAKVENRRYYYHCDRLGMLVWQDQVSADQNSADRTVLSPPWTRLEAGPEEGSWTASEHKQFMGELDEMVGALESHPSIVVWVPFNEAWGQHRSLEVGAWIMKRDPSRLTNIASGGNFWPVGDIVDSHSYPAPQFPDGKGVYKDFVKVVGEFGGHGLALPGHLWSESGALGSHAAAGGNWGYGKSSKHASQLREVRHLRRFLCAPRFRHSKLAALLPGLPFVHAGTAGAEGQARDRGRGVHPDDGRGRGGERAPHL